MDKRYVAGGTIQKCPYTGTVETVTFIDESEGRKLDRSRCPCANDCTDSDCPLVEHLKEYY